MLCIKESGDINLPFNDFSNVSKTDKRGFFQFPTRKIMISKPHFLEEVNHGIAPNGESRKLSILI